MYFLRTVIFLFCLFKRLKSFSYTPLPIEPFCDNVDCPSQINLSISYIDFFDSHSFESLENELCRPFELERHGDCVHRCPNLFIWKNDRCEPCPNGAKKSPDNECIIDCTPHPCPNNYVFYNKICSKCPIGYINQHDDCVPCQEDEFWFDKKCHKKDLNSNTSLQNNSNDLAGKDILRTLLAFLPLTVFLVYLIIATPKINS